MSLHSLLNLNGNSVFGFNFSVRCTQTLRLTRPASSLHPSCYEGPASCWLLMFQRTLICVILNPLVLPRILFLRGHEHFCHQGYFWRTFSPSRKVRRRPLVEAKKATKEKSTRKARTLQCKNRLRSTSAHIPVPTKSNVCSSITVQSVHHESHAFSSVENLSEGQVKHDYQVEILEQRHAQVEAHQVHLTLQAPHSQASQRSQD